MSNDKQRERVMAWAYMMQDRPHSFASGHLPNYADFSATLLAQETEIEQLRQQIAEFAQERGNFTRTIFELRGIIEQDEAANRGQTYEIGNLRDHRYNQAGRITELEEQIGAYRNYGVDQAEEVTRLLEALDEACEIIIVLTDDDESDPRIKAWRDKHTREALAGAKGAEEVTRLREVLKQLDRDLESMGMLPEGGKIAMVRAMRVDVDKALAVKGAEDGRTAEERDNIPSGGDSHTGVCSTGSSPAGPTPLSEPLKPLELSDARNLWSETKVWSANIVAAIGHLDFVQHEQGCAMVESVDRADKMQERLDALEKRLYNIGLGD
jgi:hypothetical protein